MTAERIVLSFDPGVTTGAAAVRLHPSYVRKIDMMSMFQDFATVFKLISGYRKEPGLKLQIVTEDIVGSGVRTVPLVRAIQVEGYIIGLAETLGIPCAKQPPQTRLPFRTEARALRLKEFPHTKGDHAPDALAHALAYLYKEAHPNASKR